MIHTTMHIPKSNLFKKWATPSSTNNRLPQFLVGTRNGFLPRQPPLVNLPPKYAPLEHLLDRMPLEEPGSLLAAGKFGPTLLKELPELDVSEAEKDSRLQMALFRDYTFAASAYLLEPCELNFRKTGDYGLGRDVLPRNIAVPLSKLAKQLNTHPYMEYAQSYALYNYKIKDPKNCLEFDNLELIRKFSGLESERGFICVHVAMVAKTPKLVVDVLNALEAIETDNRRRFIAALEGLTSTMGDINEVMETMWGRSLPKDYSRFRTFIMGTKNQPMFPNGVIYEGVSDKPTFLRGESGANDSIIPTIDNLLQLTRSMPKNPLTDTLRDFRSYRPVGHREWLSWLEETAEKYKVRDYAKKDYQSIASYMRLLNQVRDFRHRHWNFTKEYIIKYSKHPVATGGSPITVWLPNQLGVVLDVLKEMGDCADTYSVRLKQGMDGDVWDIEKLLRLASIQRDVLNREVAKLREQFKQ